MAKPDKKQRHKAKREAKRREARRRDSISPIKRLAESNIPAKCWMSSDFEQFGQAQIFVYKQAAGLSAIACFLIDRGVVGLKDAWSRTKVDRAELKSMLDAGAQRGIPMDEVPLEDARRLIAGSVRWAHQNGMRLPKDWQKTAALLGGVGDWASADISQFAMEFSGHPADLRQRLIAEPFESYIRRTDIDFVFSESAPLMNLATGQYIDDEDDDEDFDEDDLDSFEDGMPREQLELLREKLTPVALILTDKTVQWHNARGSTLSTEIFEAWQSIIMASILSNAAAPGASEETRAGMARKLMEVRAAGVQASESSEHEKGLTQAFEFLRSDPAMIANTMRQLNLIPGSATNAPPL